MLIVSSPRPFETLSHYNKDQIKAKLSWEKSFKEILYVSHWPLDEELSGPNVKIVKSNEDFPTIKFMAAMCSGSPYPYAVMANSDIEIDPKGFARVIEAMDRSKLFAATSRRYTYYGEDKGEATILPGDFGLDIFVAKPEAWGEVVNSIPSDLYIGHNGWDTWMMRFFATRYGMSFRNFSDYRCVFHPMHKKFTDRTKPVHNIETAVGKEPFILYM